MTHIETACYALVASAFVLAGMLVYSLGAHTQNEAYAGLLVAKDNFSVMTALTGNGQESLFILDNAAARLYIYDLEVTRERLDLIGGADLRRVFSGDGAGEETPTRRDR